MPWQLMHQEWEDKKKKIRANIAGAPAVYDLQSSLAKYGSYFDIAKYPDYHPSLSD